MDINEYLRNQKKEKICKHKEFKEGKCIICDFCKIKSDTEKAAEEALKEFRQENKWLR